MENKALGEVAIIKMGQSPKGDSYNALGQGTPLLNGPTEFGFYHPYPKTWTTTPTKLCKPGDILFCVRGSTTGRMNWADQEYCLGRGLAAFSAKNNSHADTKFLYYSLVHLLPSLLGLSAGSVFPNLSNKDFTGFEIGWPPEKNRNAIADVLGSLDDKIELNRRMNATLEELARSVFRQWFMESEEAAGWKVVPLPEVISVNPFRSLKKEDVAPYLDMANMPTQGHRAIEWIDRPFGSGTKFTNGDTLVARITPCLENGKTAFVDFLADGQVGWGSTEYIILHPKPPLPPEYGYYLARSEELRNHTIQNMTGTSGRQRAPASCFDKYMLAVPPESLANRFGDFARSIMTKIRSNDEQSRTLAALRDALLPRLMSGEVRVKEG